MEDAWALKERFRQAAPDDQQAISQAIGVFDMYISNKVAIKRNRDWLTTNGYPRNERTGSDCHPVEVKLGHVMTTQHIELAEWDEIDFALDEQHAAAVALLVRAVAKKDGKRIYAVNQQLFVKSDKWGDALAKCGFVSTRTFVALSITEIEKSMKQWINSGLEALGVLESHCVRSIIQADGQTHGPEQPRAERVRNKKLNARDKWIYSRLSAGDRYSKIIADLKRNEKGWEPIKSPQGIRKAARKWAKDNDKPPIPPRYKPKGN